MPTNAVISDLEQFKAFLAAQPLCKWSAEKQRDLAAGAHGDLTRLAAAPPKKKDDNADLVAALSSMA